jgi:glycine cleavage system H protein
VKPQDLHFATTHEWLHVDRGASPPVGTVGISAFAVEQLSDLVFLELPEVGRTLKAGESLGEVESVKSVSDIYSPVSGQVIAVNSDLPDQLEKLQNDPYGEGWFVKIRLADESELKNLLGYAAYQKQCAEEG